MNESGMDLKGKSISSGGRAQGKQGGEQGFPADIQCSLIELRWDDDGGEVIKLDGPLVSKVFYGGSFGDGLEVGHGVGWMCLDPLPYSEGKKKGSEDLHGYVTVSPAKNETQHLYRRKDYEKEKRARSTEQKRAYI